jgi:hypothetical protein
MSKRGSKVPDGGISSSMGRYSCPICNEDVEPVAVGRISDGRIAPSADGLLVETKQCVVCGEFLERTPLDGWHTAGSLTLGREAKIVEFR